MGDQHERASEGEELSEIAFRGAVLRRLKSIDEHLFVIWATMALCGLLQLLGIGQ